MKLKVNGNLTMLLDSFVENFERAIAGPSTSDSLIVSGGAPYVARLSGRTLEVPVTGPDFLEGILTRMELEEIDLNGPRGDPEFIDRLVLTGIKVAASDLFDLIRRTSASARGDFEEAAFQAALKGDWKFVGGREADVIGPGSWMALKGDDRISAGAGDDIVNGGRGRDTIIGSSGNDGLWGGTGDDALSGGTGDDHLTGGSGADVFVFARYGGADEVADFDPAVDRLDLGDAGPFHVAEVEGGAQIQFEGGSVLLRGVAAGAVTDDLLV